jgi:hypothetical protein
MLELGLLEAVGGAGQVAEAVAGLDDRRWAPWTQTWGVGGEGAEAA